MKFTDYFNAMRQRPDRASLRWEWIQQVVDHPEKEMIQNDSHIRRWAAISERNADGICVLYCCRTASTVHNAFFDRTFKS